MTSRESIARRTLDGLRDFSDRLKLAGGDLRATGLKTTYVRQCETCAGIDAAGCMDCSGTGFIRTVDYGTGESN